jgi:hypothetical protein
MTINWSRFEWITWLAAAAALGFAVHTLFTVRQAQGPWVIAGDALEIGISAAACVWAFFVTRRGLSLATAAIVSAFSCSALIILFALAYRDLGLIDTADGTVVTDPSNCLYFSIVTWTTLGFGDFRPSPAARPFAAAEAIVGYLFMVISIAFVALYLPSTSKKL